MRRFWREFWPIWSDHWLSSWRDPWFYLSLTLFGLPVLNHFWPQEGFKQWPLGWLVALWVGSVVSVMTLGALDRWSRERTRLRIEELNRATRSPEGSADACGT